MSAYRIGSQKKKNPSNVTMGSNIIIMQGEYREKYELELTCVKLELVSFSVSLVSFEYSIQHLTEILLLLLLSDSSNLNIRWMYERD